MANKPRILVADDDKLVQCMISDTLVVAGYSVLPAFDGEQALTRARSEHPDLIVLDILMPKLNGIQVAKELKSDPATCGIPIIVVSSLPETTAAQASRAEVYLQKPVSTFELLKHVWKLLHFRAVPPTPQPGAASISAPR